MQRIVDARFYETEEGFYLQVDVDRQPYSVIGPFETAGERDRFLDELSIRLARDGATEIPVKEQ